MITLIEDMPGETVGLEATGKVTEADYSTVLVPAVKSALESGKVRLLYLLGDDFDAYSAGAIWADSKLWAGHTSGWERVAVVTNHGWIHDAVQAFAWLMPGEIKTFEPGDLAEAREWVAG